MYKIIKLAEKLGYKIANLFTNNKKENFLYYEIKFHKDETKIDYRKSFFNKILRENGKIILIFSEKNIIIGIDENYPIIEIFFSIYTNSEIIKIDNFDSQITYYFNYKKNLFGKNIVLVNIKNHQINEKKKLDFDESYKIINFENKVKELELIGFYKPSLPNLPSIGNYIGYAEYKNKKIKFGIKEDDRLRHIYIIGKTGTGKSTLLANMIKNDIEAGNGLSVIDPHGDLIETILNIIPENKIKDTILFDPSDINYPISFNVFDDIENKTLLASSILLTFKKLFSNSRGPRLEYILRNTLLTILNEENPTLLYIPRILTDKIFRSKIINKINDPILTKFWKDEYDKRNESYRQEAIAPIINKIGQFLSSDIIRNILGQPKSKLKIKEIIKNGKILLVNLSKGKIGEDNAIMLGSLIITKIQIDSMSKAFEEYENRKPFFLYIDEFQNFTTDAFETILSESRKYKLGLTIANQYISQIPENIKNAIFGNIGTYICFSLGYEDALFMSKQLKINVDDIINLPKYSGYVKLLVDGKPLNTFFMKTIPIETKNNYKDIIINNTRSIYCETKDKVEKYIKNWFEGIEEKQSNIEDIKIGERYEGYVKLKYNYGLFVQIKGTNIEGLLHKTKINCPNGENRKKLYNIGDKIKVKVEGFTLINGEKKVIWTQI